LSTGLPSAPWQLAQIWVFSSMLCADSGAAQTLKSASATTPGMQKFSLPLIYRSDPMKIRN
jgi:hypothetical protein